MKNIRLSEKEFQVLINHWNINLLNGWGGTFGGYADNEKQLKKRMLSEEKIAVKILKKLIKLQ